MLTLGDGNQGKHQSCLLYQRHIGCWGETSKGKKNEELLFDPTPSETLTSHSASATEAIDDEHRPTYVTPRVEWIARVDIARLAVENLGKCLNEVDVKFKTFEEFTLKENDNICKELEGPKHAEYAMKKTLLLWSVGSWMH